MYPKPVIDYMQDSQMFAELGYHFAKNPAELDTLTKLTPIKQLVALGKIEAILRPFGAPAAAPAPKAEEVPNGKPAKAAPSDETGFTPSKARSDAPVIRPLNSSDGQQVEIDPREMTTRQMIADFQAKKGVNLSIRKRH